MNEPISMVADVKPPVAAAIAAYLDSHKEWDCDRIVNAALAMFLLQGSNSGDPELARVYLQAVFGDVFQVEEQP
jgi:hypothetical protein